MCLGVLSRLCILSNPNPVRGCTVYEGNIHLLPCNVFSKEKYINDSIYMCTVLKCISSYRFHAERAIDIITHILPEDHLLLASSKRVKGKPRQ